MGISESNAGLFQSILEMDAYNRGYGAGISITSAQLGLYNVSSNSSEKLLDANGAPRDIGASFFAQSYTLNGKTIISYRGTDSRIADVTNGYGVGVGLILSDSTPNMMQAKLAIEFFNSVSGRQDSDVLLTGHSLGGSLAAEYAVARPPSAQR